MTLKCEAFERGWILSHEGRVVSVHSSLRGLLETIHRLLREGEDMETLEGRMDVTSVSVTEDDIITEEILLLTEDDILTKPR